MEEDKVVPTQSEADPDTSSIDFGDDDTILDEQIAEGFDNFLTLGKGPEEASNTLENVLEESEDNEQDVPSDDSNVESDDDEDDVQGELTDEVNDDADYEIVDYAELKDKALPIKRPDGTIEHKTIAQIQSELRNAHTTSTTRTEMKAQEEALIARETRLADLEQQSQVSNDLANEYRQLNDFRNQMSGIQQAMAQARDNQDVGEYNRLDMHLRDMNGRYNQGVVHVQGQESQLQAAKEASIKEALQDRGYGGLNSDTQRYSRLEEFTTSEFSPQTWALAKGNPEVLVALEMARLHKSNGKEASKAKLKGTGRTMKAGAKTSTPSKVKAKQQRIRSGDASQDEIDNHILTSSKFFS